MPAANHRAAALRASGERAHRLTHESARGQFACGEAHCCNSVSSLLQLPSLPGVGALTRAARPADAEAALREGPSANWGRSARLRVGRPQQAVPHVPPWLQCHHHLRSKRAPQQLRKNDEISQRGRAPSRPRPACASASAASHCCCCSFSSARATRAGKVVGFCCQGTVGCLSDSSPQPSAPELRVPPELSARQSAGRSAPALGCPSAVAAAQVGCCRGPDS